MLQIFAMYLLKVTICSGLLLAYYWATLRNKRFHYYNRFYLLMAVALSIVLPMLNLQLFILKSNSDNVIHLLNVIHANGENDVVIKGTQGFDLQQLLTIALFGVAVCMLISLATRVVKIYQFKKIYPVSKIHQFDFINTDLRQAPFSFLKNIFWRNDISVEDTTGQQILQHELTHIKQKHTWDKLFMQIVLCVFWMNPVYWLIRSELYFIHEFIADEKAVNNKDASAFAEMLLHAQYGRSIFSPAQSFLYSPIKRRLLMLTTSKEPRFTYARRILALPLLSGIVLLFAFRLQKENALTIIKPNAPFKVVVDAGHGGTDNGAIGLNGAKEKDLDLAISKKVKEFSLEYGIDVVLTRDKDVYMSPSEKVDFSKAQNADAFISIHVNQREANEAQTRSGMEICISADNSKYNESKLLGSAVIQNLNIDFKVNNALVQRKEAIWVLKANTLPAILIECGYIDNDADLNILHNESKIELIAKRILQGIAMYSNHKIESSGVLDGQKGYDHENIDQKNNKSAFSPQAFISYNDSLLYVINGKIVTASEVMNLESGKIYSMNVLKGNDAIKKYGDKGKNGVIEITTNTKKVTTPKETIIYVVDEKVKEPIIVRVGNPSFPGGSAAWKKYLENNLNVKTLADKKAPPGKYTVVVSFNVDTEGNVSNVKAQNDPGYGAAPEAVRVIANSGKWVPAQEDNGKKVAAQAKQTITFQVTGQ